MRGGRRAVAIRDTGGRPVASGTSLGGLFFASSVRGIHPDTGALGGGPEEQFSLAFKNLAGLLGASGLSTDQVAHVTVLIPDASYRPHINPAWLEQFPDADHRPARKTTHVELPDGEFVELQGIAVLEGSRRALEIAGLAHRDPLPMGAAAGSLVLSSVLGGDDPSTGERPEGEAQLRQCFANMRSLVEQAGGSVDDIVQVWAYLGDFGYQPTLVRVWLEMFPEDGNRPARKTIPYDLGGRTALIQLQMVAVLGGHSRENFEIPGIGHHDPIPLAARKGDLLCSSGIDGRAPTTGELAKGPQGQAQQALANLGMLMELAGGSLDNVGHVTAMVGDLGYARGVEDTVAGVFPREDDRPALQILQLGVPARETLVQLHATAIFS